MIFIGKQYTAEQINGSFRYLLASRAFRSIALSFATLALPLYLVFVLKLGLIGVGAVYFGIVLFVSISSFVFGVLSDKIGYVRTMIISEILPLVGMAGFVASTLLVGSPGTALTVVIVSSMLTGISGVGGMRGAFSAGQLALIANNWKDEKDRVHKNGRIITVASIASIVGSFLLAFQGIVASLMTSGGITDAAASVLSYRYLFAFSTLLIFLSIACLYLVKEAPREKKQHMFIKKESSPHMFRVMASQLIAGFGLGLALPILPAMVAKAFLLSSAVASQVIGYIFGIGYIVVAIMSLYISRLVYKREIHTLKLASWSRVGQGTAFMLMALAISFGSAMTLHEGIGIALFGLFYLMNSAFVGMGIPLRATINVRGIHDQDYGTASAAMGVSIQVPQASAGLSGFLSEALAAFIALPVAIGGFFLALSGVVYWKFLSGREAKIKEQERG